MHAAEMRNQLREHLNHVLSKINDARADGTVSFGEMWGIVWCIGKCVHEVLHEYADLGPEDESEVVDIVQVAYDKWIKPLNLPGPDALIDSFFRNTVVPGLVAGIFAWIRDLKEKADSE